MDSILVAAIISAGGAIMAVVVGYILRKRTMGEHPNDESAPKPNISARDIQAGRDVILSGRDTTIIRPDDDRFMSQATAKLVSKVADEIIEDRSWRSRWSSFDARFLETCFRQNPRGWIFDGAAFKKLLNWENDPLFDLSVRVYNEVCLRLGNAHADYENLVLVEETYVTARYMLRGFTLLKHPKRNGIVEDYQGLWDGSETGWCLVRSIRNNETEEPFSPIIFNRLKKGAMVIDDLPLHRAVIARMKEAGIPVFDSMEVAMGSKNDKNRENTEDATAVIHCECGAMIVVSGIPIPPPRRFHVRCEECGIEKDLSSSDFSSLRIDE